MKFKPALKVLGYGLATGAAGVTAYTLSDEQRRQNAMLLLQGADRAFAASWCGFRIVVDYKFSLRGLKDTSEEYKRIRSEVHTRSAQRMLRLARRNKGVFVKAGQHIAALKPAVPAEYSDCLAVLQDNAPPSPFDAVKSVVEEELGGPLARFFVEFELVPKGSASLAQVHRAVTLQGDVVAVKVQHRGLQQLCQSDLLTLQRLTDFVAWSFPDFQFQWIMPEFRTNLMRELDFVNEAKNSERCAYNFRHNAQLYVPKVVWAKTTSRVLTMEFMDALRINDVQGLAHAGLNSGDVAGVVIDVFSQQIFRDGFVHCDPHPGNLLVRPLHQPRWSDFPAAGAGNWLSGWWWFLTSQVGWHWGRLRGRALSQVILLDHGLYRDLDESFRLDCCGMWKAMIVQDEAALRYHCERMGVGRYADLFPLLLTYRSINSKVGLGQRMTAKERQQIREKYKFNEMKFSDFNTFLEQLPRDMLFVFRTNNLVRALNFDLGGTSAQRFRAQALACVRGLTYHNPAPLPTPTASTAPVHMSTDSVTIVKSKTSAHIRIPTPRTLYDRAWEFYAVSAMRLRLLAIDVVLSGIKLSNRWLGSEAAEEPFEAEEAQRGSQGDSFTRSERVAQPQ